MAVTMNSDFYLTGPKLKVMNSSTAMTQTALLLLPDSLPWNIERGELKHSVHKQVQTRILNHIFECIQSLLKQTNLNHILKTFI